MKLIMENWRNFVDEAIIDKTATTLSDIFGEDKKLKPEVVKAIEKGISDIRQQFPDLEILDYYVVGAAVTYQYAPTSDIDTTIVVPKDMDPKEYKIIDKWIEKNIDPLYKHEQRPFQFKASPKTRDELQSVDAAYDVRKQQWIKKPDKDAAASEFEKRVADPESYENRAYKSIERVVQPALDRLKKEIERTFSGSPEPALQEAPESTIDNSRVNDQMAKVYQIYKKIKSLRSKSYSGTDDRVKDRISQNWGTGNIIYKFLDREGYNDIFSLVKKAVKSNFEIVDGRFLKDLHQKISKTSGDEIGFSR